MTPFRHDSPVWLSAIFVLALPGLAAGQWPQPRLSSVYPAGGQVGKMIEIEVGGSDLDGVDRLWFSDDRLRATHLDGIRFQVEVGSEVPIGQHDVRAVGRFGVSNPRTFVVGTVPEICENEPNDQTGQANHVELGMVVNGRSDKRPDVDTYSFEGKAGDRVCFRLSGFEIDSRMDGTLRVFAPGGRELSLARDTYGGESGLDLILPEDGTYRTQVQDVVYAGSPEHVYRLALDQGPRIESVSPILVEPGREVMLTIVGRNLNGDATQAGTGSDPFLEQHRRPLTMPTREELARKSLDPLGYLPAWGAGRLGHEFVLQTEHGRSNPIFLAAAEHPILQEIEPNDGTDSATNVALPCEITGTFDHPGDRDRFQFQARSGDIIWIEAFAERIGSPADVGLFVQQIEENGGVRDLASADDTLDPRDYPVTTSTIDPILRWQAPSDGMFQVVAQDVHDSRRGDDHFRYRLSLRTPEPDFDLYVAPIGVAPQPLGLTVHRGGRSLARAVIKRRDGFDGPVRVEACELPRGVSMTPTYIGPGQTDAPLVFEASPDAEPTVGNVRLTGTGISSDRKEALRYEVGRSQVEAEPSHEAWALTDIRPEGNPNNPYRAMRVARGMVMAIAPDESPFRIAATPDRPVVGRPHELAITVAIDRSAGFEEPIEITVTDLPPNVKAPNLTIPKDQSTGTIAVPLPDQLPPGIYTFVLRGTAPYSFKKSPSDEKASQLQITELSNPITLTVHE